MKPKQIKELVKNFKKEKKEVNQDFYSKMVVPMFNKDMDVNTLYYLLYVKNIDQMLNTMREDVIKMYKLHEPTLEKLAFPNIRKEINAIMEKKGINKRL